MTYDAYSPDRSGRQVTASDACEDFSIKIALINNTADEALRTTERQFCALLSAASGGFLIDLRCYSIPEILRGEEAASHIGRHYNDYGELADWCPDGIIITGTEPSCADITDEVFWPTLAKLIDWMEDEEVPGIWSCLAAHAAVFRMDGIRRRPLARKLSGIFECRLQTHKHALLHLMPPTWSVPHSRRNTVERRELDARGYEVLSFSREVGVDVFAKVGSSLQLFLHGHPEYEPNTLLAEYRRDMRRALQSHGSPSIEFPRGIHDDLRKSARQPLRFRRVDKEVNLSSCSETMYDAVVRDRWSASASQLFANWFAHLALRSKQRGLPRGPILFRQNEQLACVGDQPVPVRA